MLVSYTREEQLFESFAEIAVIVTYPHEAGLDDVGHNYVFFVRLSTLIVLEKEECYMGNEEIFIFLSRISKLLLTLGQNN